VLFLRVWQPSEPLLGRLVSAPPAIAGAAVADPALEQAHARGERRRLVEAYAPYAIIVVVFGLAQWAPIKEFLANRTVKFTWPGLDVANSAGEPLASATYAFNYLAAAGTLLFISGLLTVAVLRLRPLTAARTYVRTMFEIRWAVLTVASVLALAYVMNQSGVTTTLGLWVAGAGGVLYAFLSPIIGWFGVAVTGSDTSSNSLFGSLQIAAAKNAGLPELLTAGANSSGGVMGKMVSPQNLAIGLAAVNMASQEEERFTEGDLFRRVIGWSLAMLLLMAVIVMLQATDVLGWMVPG
jgi:lactate permease